MTLLLTERYRDALVWALALHADQVRKGRPTPYVGHLLRVGGRVLDWAESEDEAIAALLHDAAEDCGGQATLEEIQRLFGANVARLVEQCSDSLTEDPAHKAPWRERKESFLRRARNADVAAKRIMLCDKLDNLQSTVEAYRQQGETALSIFKQGREIVWYFRAMYEILREGTPPELVEEMRYMVEELEGNRSNGDGCRCHP